MNEPEPRNPIRSIYSRGTPQPDAVWRRAAMISRAVMYLAGAVTAGLSAWSMTHGPNAKLLVMSALTVMLLAGFATMVFTVAGNHTRRMRPPRPPQERPSA